MDRETVITHLQIIHTWAEFARERDLQFFTAKHMEDIAQWADDALKLLKEQEPILLENQHKPYGISTNANSPWISRCPRCGKKIEGKQTRFCKYCGQAVKWDERRKRKIIVG